jgi:glycosyltransferase involved in cell wall biosynthesis
MTGQIDTLILTFAPGRSLTTWDDLGRLERELPFIDGLRSATKSLLFLSSVGPRDHEVAARLTREVGFPIDAVALAHPDPELGEGRPPSDRVLARLGRARTAVIQTMQLIDGGISARLIGPIRRAGIQAALVARGGFVESRVRAAAVGPHAHAALVAGAEEQALCRHAQIVIGASASVIEDLAWRHGINPARTRVIPHFAIAGEDPEDVPERHPGHVLAVGTLTPSRGADTILHAASRLPDRVRESTTFELVGDGPERDRLRALASELNVNLELPGRLPYEQVIQRMRTCTVFAHASPLRRQSRSVLEALACGCATVVSDVPEYDGLVENASTGIRVKPTPEAFAFALESLLGDADWRGMLGAAASRTVKAACGIDLVIERTSSAYADALALSPQAVPARPRRAG